MSKVARQSLRTLGSRRWRGGQRSHSGMALRKLELWTRWAALVALVGVTLSCQLRRRGSSESSSHADANDIELASSNAFDLVADSAGLTLVFAPAKGSALATLSIDADGFSSGPIQPLMARASVAGRIGELSALRSKGALVAAFSEGGGGRATLKALWQRGAEPATAFVLGVTHTLAPPARGNVAIAANGEEALVFARADAAPCASDPTRACAGFRVYRLRQGKPDTIGLPLAVPAPCEGASLVVALTPARWRYGVCSRENDKSATTLFTIERDPDYASAESLLPGCAPRALSVWGERTLLLADCAGAKSALELDGAPPRAPKELAAPKTSCPAGVARVLLDNGELELSAPRAGLEALLPENMASRHARAAWAGRALVVATPSSRGLTLTRYACSAGIFSADRVRPRPAQ